MKKRRRAGYGWRPSLPDIRDFRFSASANVLQNLPPSVDLRSQCPPILDQGQIGSCTANALSAAVQFDRMKNGDQPAFTPSRLFIYYNERSAEGDIPMDGGAYLRDGIKSLASQGVCPEDLWPYVPTPPLVDGGAFPVGSPPVTQPPQNCYDVAVNYKISQYLSVDQSIAQLRGALAHGYPFVFGFSVYDNWDNGQDAPSATIPLPSSGASQVGGHAVLVVGYDDSTSLFTIHNSWGTSAGDGGYFYIPYSYLTDSSLASDFWVIQSTLG